MPTLFSSDTSGGIKEKKIKGGLLKSQDIGGGQMFESFTPTATPDVTKKDISPSISGAVKPEAPITPTAAPKKPTPPVTKTIDSRPEDFGAGGLQTPSFLGGLSAGEEKIRKEELDTQIKDIETESAAEIADIQAGGKQALGSAKGFLAKVGALGRTISGAPMETNLGVLSSQNNKIKEAVKAAQDEADSFISQAKTGSAKAAQSRVDELNKLIQQNFDNAFKLIQEDRLVSGEERQARLADVTQQRLEFDIEKATVNFNKENVEDAIGDIERMAESGIPIDQISVGLINQLEQEAELPVGTFEAFFSSIADAKQIANEENLAKVAKLKADILTQVGNLEISKQKQMLAEAKEGRLGRAATRAEEEKGEITISTANKNRMIGAGLSTTDIANIEENINAGFSLDEILDGSDITDTQKTTIRNTMSGVTPTQEVKAGEEKGEFLNEAFFKTQFNTDQLEQAAMDAGFGDLGEGLFNLKDVDTEAFLKDLQTKIQSFRDAGFSDEEILKKLQ